MMMMMMIATIATILLIGWVQYVELHPKTVGGGPLYGKKYILYCFRMAHICLYKHHNMYKHLYLYTDVYIYTCATCIINKYHYSDITSVHDVVPATGLAPALGPSASRGFLG